MKNRRWLILLIVGLLLIPFNLFVPDASAGADSPSPADEYTLAWNETLSQLCINLSDSDSDGMEYTISQNSVVLESGGTFVYTNTSHNFTDTVNNSASWESAKGSISGGYALTNTVEFTSGEYENISVVNNSWNGDWSYYKTIIIESSYIDNDTKNFPVLVNSTDAVMIGKCQASGEDIRFVSTDNSTEFFYEIERWTPDGFDVWVNISETIASDEDYTFLMYYGNADVSDGQSPSDVWDSNYVMVQHMNDETSSTILDSTIYDNDGSKKGANEPIEMDGKIGKGQDFNGSSGHYINCGSDISLDCPTSVTVECWFRPDVLPVLSVTENLMYGSWNIMRLFIEDSSFKVAQGLTGGGHSTSYVLPSVKWYYGALTVTDGSQYTYVDSDIIEIDTKAGTLTTLGALNYYLGSKNLPDSHLNGTMDEARISNIVRNSSWISASFHNQNRSSHLGSSFLSFGSEQSMMGVNTSACYPTVWNHHNFSFNLSNYVIHNITGLEVRWHGYGGYYAGGVKPKWSWGTTMYFDTDGSGWYTADSTTPYTTDDYDPSLEWINYSAHHEMSDWLDENNVLNVAVEHTSASNCSVIYTDYIELIVTEISGGVPNGTYCTSNVSWWNDTCDMVWSWVVYVDDGRDGSSSTTYIFYNAPCTFSGLIYPTSGSIGVCPCSDSICVDVTIAYAFNMTVYGRSSYETNYSIWDRYVNVSADEYCFCLCGYIVDGWHQPMRFNTTYEWYVNVSKFDNSSLYNETSVFTFTTAVNNTDCIANASAIVVGGGRNDYISVIGLCGLFSIPISFILYNRLKKQRKPPNGGINYRNNKRRNIYE